MSLKPDSSLIYRGFCKSISQCLTSLLTSLATFLLHQQLPIILCSSSMVHTLLSISVAGLCFGGGWFCPSFLTPTLPFGVSSPFSCLPCLPGMELIPSYCSITPVGCRDSQGAQDLDDFPLTQYIFL